MPLPMFLHGTDAVLAALNHHIKKQQAGSRRALMKAGLLVKRRSMLKTPVDTANLKQSHYTRPFGWLDPKVEIGCTAFYAPYVHENLDARHNVGEAKFLENALNESKLEIIGILKDGAKVR